MRNIPELISYVRALEQRVKALETRVEELKQKRPGRPKNDGTNQTRDSSQNPH